MKSYTVDELKEICGKHIKWLRDEEGGERADLRGADLQGADLQGADLRGADLQDAKNSELAFAMTVVPSSGDIIGWKKAKNPAGGDCIVKLKIPEAAKRSNATGRKCRAEYAEVLDVIGAEYAISGYDGTMEYHKGQTVRPDSYDENRWNECSNGIHFFITREEAEAWRL